MVKTEREIVEENIKKVAPKEEVAVVSETPEVTVGENYKEYSGLYDLFQVSQKSPRTDEIMRKIWEWGKANSAGSDKDSIMFEIIRLKNRLGGSSIGEAPWAKTLNYVTIWHRMRSDEQLLRSLEK